MMRLRYGKPFRLYSVVGVDGSRQQFTSHRKAEELARELARQTGRPLKDVLRPSGSYYVYEYTDAHPKGRRVSTRCATLTEANDWKDRRLAKRRAHRRRPGRVALAVAIKEWLEDLQLKRRAEATIRHYRVHTAAWLRHFGAKTPVSAIESHDVREFFVARASGKLVTRRQKKDGTLCPLRRPGVQTLNMNRALLSAFFSWAQKRGYAHIDPVADIERWTEPRPEPRILSEDEVKRLLAACRDPYHVVAAGARQGGGAAKWEQEHRPPSHLYPLVVAGLLTILRYRNLAELRWSQIDFDANEIRVPNTKTHREVVVPIAPALRAELVKLGPGADDDPVFGPEVASVRRAFSSAVKRAGIKGKVTFHTLRKTGADWLRRAGVALETVQKLGGWSTPDVLLRHYRSPGEDELRAAADRLDGLVS